MNAVVAFVVVMLVWTVSDWVAKKTGSLLSSLFVASIIFLIGMVVSLRLPPRADSDPPEALPRLFSLPSRGGVTVLSGKLVRSTLFGAAVLRALFGFLTLFLAFAVRSGHLPTDLLSWHLHQTTALGLVADVVPLRDENRVFTRHGLKRLVTKPSVGLRALFDEAKLTDKLSAEDVSFKLGGRRRRIDFAITDLPEPDSPTTHRISLRMIERETSATACARSDQVGSATDRPSICRTGSLIGRQAAG